MQIHVSGRVARCDCRFTPGGRPVLELELHDAASALTVRVTHAYPDASNASGHAARALASRLRGQHLDAVALADVRLRRRLITATAAVIPVPTTTTRRDLA